MIGIHAGNRVSATDTLIDVPTTGKKKRAVVAMSGGVDSSVAAALLAEQGYDVIGVTMRLFDAPFENAGKLSKSCCSLEDVEDARATCRIIGARHYYMNFVKEFTEHVIDYFVGEYEKGRTPHPCLACNDRLKFDFLMRRAKFMDADIVATGHYAQVAPHPRGHRLLRGADARKDQSYVLYTLTQEKLARLALPVGGYAKDEIRSIAARFGLPVADKPDSQDICFIPAGNYREFVEKRLSNRKPGLLKSADGAVLGSHDGIHAFTIGQRKGLPIATTEGKPRFVTHINAATGDIIVGDAKDLLKTELWASGINWISGCAPANPVRAATRIRYNGQDSPATITPVGDWVQVTFDEPVRAITPGQAAVFYDGDEVIGGGMIEPLGPGQPATRNESAAAVMA
jgi:tRNA-specific 2-thiouridylase